MDGASTASADLDACFGRIGERGAEPVLEGRHKLARWRVRVTLRPGAPVALTAHVQGPFGLPLVQSLVLEPLLGVVAARRDLALIPGALLLDGAGRGVLVVGGSGSGKTSVAARAIAAGREVLADDRVFVDAAATATRYARRMRLYPDIRETAPAAWARLARGPRARLRGVALLRAASGRRIAPPVAIAARELGAPRSVDGVCIERVLLLRRHEGDAARLSTASAGAAADEIARRLRDDRAALDAGPLAGELRPLAQRERAVVTAAVERAAIERLEIPLAWPAARAVQRLGAELGLA